MNYTRRETDYSMFASSLSSERSTSWNMAGTSLEHICLTGCLVWVQPQWVLIGERCKAPPGTGSICQLSYADCITSIMCNFVQVVETHFCPQSTLQLLLLGRHQVCRDRGHLGRVPTVTKHGTQWLCFTAICNSTLQFCTCLDNVIRNNACKLI